MIARSIEELVAWQLASEVEREVRNTAEGFGRFRPKEFARFLEIAHASFDETKDGLHVAHRREYLTDADFGRIMKLIRRALAANAKLASYLRSCGDRQPPTAE